jgi:hypothetical protein
MAEDHDANQDPPRIDTGPAVGMTLLWAVPLLLFSGTPLLGAPPWSLGAYKAVRYVLIGALLLASAMAIKTAWRYIGGAKTDPPWYTNGYLVGAVVFWAIAPPSWFFTEYFLFDSGQIAVPTDIPCQSTVLAECLSEQKAEYLRHVKTYADLASRIWAAVGASLGAAIAASRK